MQSLSGDIFKGRLDEHLPAITQMQLIFVQGIDDLDVFLRSLPAPASAVPLGDEIKKRTLR